MTPYKVRQNSSAFSLYMVITINSSVCRGGSNKFCLRRSPEVEKPSGSVVTAVYLPSSEKTPYVAIMAYRVVFCSSTPLTGRNCAKRVGIGMSTAKNPFSSKVVVCLILRCPAALCVRRPTLPVGAGPKCCVDDASISPCIHSSVVDWEVDPVGPRMWMAGGEVGWPFRNGGNERSPPSSEWADRPREDSLSIQPLLLTEGGPYLVMVVCRSRSTKNAFSTSPSSSTGSSKYPRGRPSSYSGEGDRDTCLANKWFRGTANRTVLE